MTRAGSVEACDDLLEAADLIKQATAQGDWTDRAEADLLEMEKDLRGIAAVGKDRAEGLERPDEVEA